MKMLPYVPLDIPVNLPNEDDLYNFCISNSYAETYNFERGILVNVCSKLPADDWRSATDLHGGLIFDPGKEEISRQYEKEWYDRCNTPEGLGNLYFHPDFESKFPSLVEAFTLFPFKYITHAMMMLIGKIGSALHNDPPVLQLYPGFEEPNLEFTRFNIQLNCFKRSQMFWTDGRSKSYLKISKEYPCYAFNNKDFLHGSDAPDEANKRRMQILVYGVIDPIKYAELISRSKEKFING